MAYAVEKTDAEWREELSPDEYKVLRKAGTERAFTGKYTDTETKGDYSCKACGAKHLESDTKVYSACSWPALNRMAGKREMGIFLFASKPD